MMNSIETQPITPIAPPAPTLEAPQFPLDPTNPLVWILVISALLGNTDEVLYGMAELIRAIASLKRNKPRNRKQHKE